MERPLTVAMSMVSTACSKRVWLVGSGGPSMIHRDKRRITKLSFTDATIPVFPKTATLSCLAVFAPA